MLNHRTCILMMGIYSLLVAHFCRFICRISALDHGDHLCPFDQVIDCDFSVVCVLCSDFCFSVSHLCCAIDLDVFCDIDLCHNFSTDVCDHLVYLCRDRHLDVVLISSRAVCVCVILNHFRYAASHFAVPAHHLPMLRAKLLSHLSDQSCSRREVLYSRFGLALAVLEHAP